MKARIYHCVLALATLALPMACNFVEIPAPKDQLVRDNVFNSDQSATAVVSGIYNGLIDASGQLGNLGIVTELASDQLTYTGEGSGYAQFVENDIDESNGIVQNLWTAFYRNIHRCNSALEGLSGATGISDGLRDQLRGEALAIRAFCYFHLVHLWGDVPLITGTDYRVNQTVGRTPSADIHAAIAADLSEAEGLLPDAYPSANRSRINRRAVKAMQARVYWMLGDWQRAESAAAAVIDDPVYALESPEAVFLLESRETVWQLVPHNFPAQAPTYIPGQPDILPTHCLGSGLVEAFEPNDLRREEWVGTNTVNDIPYHYPYKYRVPTGNNPATEALVVLRLAEQYLIRAEARAMLGNAEGALADLDAVRQRAGLAELDVRDEAFSVAIAHERRVELFAEWGFRWLDLKRSGTAEEVLSPLKPGWQATDVLWPLPLTERQRNPNLAPQNGGY